MEEDGQYICHAENIAGQTTSIATIEVQSLPQITISPKSGVISLREGERLRLECHATGHPQPTVHWTRLPDGAYVYFFLYVIENYNF